LLSQVLATADSAARSATKVVAIENLIMNTDCGCYSGDVEVVKREVCMRKKEKSVEE